MSEPVQRRARVQRVLLRFMAAVLFTGIPGALLPGVAFEKLSWLVGYGKPPLTPLTMYLSGNAGYAYTVLGVFTWVMARDVTRYRTLVRVFGWLLVLGGPGYYSIDFQCGLPIWWRWIDSLSCLAVGSGLIWATGGVRAVASAPGRNEAENGADS